MKIDLVARWFHETPSFSVSKSGDALTINGKTFDFSAVPDGATVEHVPTPWIVGPVHRVGGTLHIPLMLPHGPNPEAWQAFPDPIDDAPDGDLDLPFDTYRTVGEDGTVTIYRWNQEPEVIAGDAKDDSDGTNDGDG